MAITGLCQGRVRKWWLLSPCWCGLRRGEEKINVIFFCSKVAIKGRMAIQKGEQDYILAYLFWF